MRQKGIKWIQNETTFLSILYIYNNTIRTCRTKVATDKKKSNRKNRNKMMTVSSLRASGKKINKIEGLIFILLFLKLKKVM